MNENLRQVSEDTVNCLVTIITFNPDVQKLSKNINSILALQDPINILIIDNASDNIAEICNLIACHDNIRIIKNDKNLGIAHALNQAMQDAENNSYEWVLTCDQDSVLPKNLLTEYKNVLNKFTTAIVCPKIYDVNANRFIDYKKTIDEFTEINGCITSGSLVNTRAWKDVCGFDDFMFIDGVDFDFCYRLRIKDYKIIRANKVILEHEIGKSEIRHFFWKKVNVQNHNAFRKYYIMRNRVYCDYKHYKKCRFITYLYYLKFKLIILLYEKEKRKKLKAVRSGFKDGKKAGRNFLKTNYNGRK